ncbi:MAG: hypothetical protein ACR2L2_11325 [Acidobacteriota bacterium]
MSAAAPYCARAGGFPQTPAEESAALSVPAGAAPLATWHGTPIHGFRVGTAPQGANQGTRVLFHALLRHGAARESTSLSQSLPVSEPVSAVARIVAWIAEDSAGGAGDWELLKAELDQDRLSSRKLFGK